MFLWVKQLLKGSMEPIVRSFLNDSPIESRGIVYYKYKSVKILPFLFLEKNKSDYDQYKATMERKPQ